MPTARKSLANEKASITLLDSSRNIDWHFLIQHPAHAIAFTFGAGLMPFAPGTFGTLAAMPIYVLLRGMFSSVLLLVVWVVLILIGVWACDRVARRIGVKDYSGVCWDETVAFLAVLYAVPDNWFWWGLAFVLFRLFDIAKPYPIGYFDARIKTGFGVMLDDLLAAFYAIVVLMIVQHGIKLLG
jgi:phosphatidylglycerophosphatase A